MRADWTRWVGSERKKVLDKLRVSIKGWLQKTTGNNLLHLANLATFGYVPDPTRGDGVTLYFEQFPTGEEAERQFKVFFQGLNEDLNGSQPPAISNRKAYAVNLLFSREALGKGIYGCEKLSDLTHDDGAIGNDKGYKVRFLVMLAEPTIDTKLELRNYLENCLSGTRRNDLLQATVPVVPYLRDKAVLKEDISYFHFNFGGLGQWLPPAGSQSDGALEVGADIREAMESFRKQTGEVKPIGVKLTDSICPWICPKRWIIFGVMEGLATLLGIAAIAAFASCKVGENMTRLSWLSIVSLVLLVLAIVLFFALLYCDPAWQSIRDGNWPLIGMVILVVAILVGLLMRQKRRASMK